MTPDLIIGPRGRVVRHLSAKQSTLVRIRSEDSTKKELAFSNSFFVDIVSKQTKAFLEPLYALKISSEMEGFNLTISEKSNINIYFSYFIPFSQNGNLQNPTIEFNCVLVRL